MDFDGLDGIARQLMLGRRSHNERETGHVYYHGNRVMRGVMELRSAYTADASHDELLRAAALFHDCGKALEPHDVSGAALVGEFLKDECTPDELREIRRLVLGHDRRDGKADMWLALLQDADLLDHYGSMETWLNFLYSAYHDRPLSMSLEFYRNEYPAQAEKHRAQLNLDISRRVFDEKLRFTYALASRLEVEGAGAYIERLTPVERS